MKLRLSAPLSRSFIFFFLFLSASYLSATHAELNEHFLTHFCISLWPRKYIQSETCIFWIPNHMTFVSGEIFSGDIFKSLVSSQMAFVHVRNVHTNNWTGYKAHKFVQVCHLYEWTLIKTPQMICNQWFHFIVIGQRKGNELSFDFNLASLQTNKRFV